MAMNATGQNPWQLHRGQYLGEISALCFLHLPHHLSSLPLVLAGTGSQVLVYELLGGMMIRSFEVFEGIRVHGISLQNSYKHRVGSYLVFVIAVFGERRVKLLNLRIQSDCQDKPLFDMELTLIHSLPKFRHWVLDVCFVKYDAVASCEEACYLAVGCSDNSVYFWDNLRCKMLSEVKCSERCLLYSMQMWGNEIESLRIASGTIFNEIVVWTVTRENDATVMGGHAEDYVQQTVSNDFELPATMYKEAHISTLIGHEGSIFRIAWFSNGLKLVSVSDDRSARIWEVPLRKGAIEDVEGVNNLTGPILFGHNARIWDCCIFDSLIITAGEDCTCRVWDFDGRELNKIKEHIGRGVWRCLYDPVSSLLVTAGFDSAIKVHHLVASSKGLELSVAQEDFSDRIEAFALSVPRSANSNGLMDSKSEYVRCLHFSCEDSLYVATNNGYLYHIRLFNNGTAKWTELARISEEAPIICMDILSKSSNPSGTFEDWIAVGDGKGIMTIVLVVGSGYCRNIEVTSNWPAEKERHLLGTYWCRSLDNSFIFTADPGGRLKLWKLYQNPASASLISRGSFDVILIAEYLSCFGMRIMCVDASLKEELIVCGDIRGNLLLFSLPRGLLCCTSVADKVEVFSSTNYFKGAHGVSSVCSVAIAGTCSNLAEIHSTGTDGCICYFQHDKNFISLEFIGMNQVRELSAVRSVFHTADWTDDSGFGTYAIGFASADFVIWNLTSERKVIQITCGGWRRPHSYYLGDVPEMMNCFSFVKDDLIYIHRHWLPSKDRPIYPRNLHFQFHGREIHSLCFISGYSLFSSDTVVSGSTWIATGCEDGTVRLTRYEPGLGIWLASKNLGEHVGGSAVRSIYCVSKIYVFMPELAGKPSGGCGEQDVLSNGKDTLILISVGAKRVLTAWKQMISTDKRVHTAHSELDNKHGLSGSSTVNSSSLSFQWLSTDMPSKHTSHMKRQNMKEVLKDPVILSMPTADGDLCQSQPSKYREKESSFSCEDNHENDWRYLDVTAFLVKVTGSRISVCFAIVACSDATVMLRALVLPFRLWFDVASLAPLSSPVLALQHVVIPNLSPCDGHLQTGNLYLALTGSTDGSIGFWDLTSCIKNFMQRASALQIGSYKELQKRPRTGRGSQGGRWWKSIDSYKVKKQTSDGRLFKCSTGPSDVGLTSNWTECGNECLVYGTSGISLSEQNISPTNHTSFNLGEREESLVETSLLAPVHVFNNVHQSGINCLSVSDIHERENSVSAFSFYITSGGDDQAINCIRCNLEINCTRDDSQNMNANINCSSLQMTTDNHNPCCLIQNYHLQFLCLDKIISAHSSAVKGVWTDGIWVFSVGVDQRVRCWKLCHDRLTEFAHVIISVPEPESLDVKAFGRNHYQIAVAGRGLQMVEFCVSSGVHCG